MRWAVSNPSTMIFSIFLFYLLLKIKISQCFSRWERQSSLRVWYSFVEVCGHLHPSEAENSVFKQTSQSDCQGWGSETPHDVFSNYKHYREQYREAHGCQVLILTLISLSAREVLSRCHAHLKIHVLHSSSSEQGKDFGKTHKKPEEKGRFGKTRNLFASRFFFLTPHLTRLCEDNICHWLLDT